MDECLETEWHPEMQVHEMITKILGEVHQGRIVFGPRNAVLTVGSAGHRPGHHNGELSSESFGCHFR